MKKFKLYFSLIIGFVILLIIIGFSIFKIETALDFVTGISSLLAALFILWTIWEMYEQRKATYQPTISAREMSYYHIIWTKEDQVIPINGKFSQKPYHSPFIEFNKEKEKEKTQSLDTDKENDSNSNKENLNESTINPLISNIKTNEEIIDKKDDILDSYKDEAILLIYNLGLGAAENIKITWEYDFDAFANKVASAGDLKLEKLNQSAYFCTQGLKGFSLTRFDFVDNTSFDFLLPVHIDRRPAVIPFAHSYCELLKALAYYSVINREKEIFKEVPRLTMNVTYKDIGLNEFSKKYTFRVNQLMRSSGEELHTEGYFILVKSEQNNPD